MLRFSRSSKNLNCDRLDCKLAGSDNTIGSLPFIAPMKNNFLISITLKNRWRFGVALLAAICLLAIGFTHGAAQLKNHKRVTGVQLGDGAEGARVTVFSDSALSDYEAFRRGDRFYVKIPLADFATTQPSFRGDGFDDVQVQTVGDSVVISFKLQPGATAHVDQRSSRLDIIFSAPNRIARNNQNANFNRVSTNLPSGVNRVNSTANTQSRQGDSAGPIPPSTPPTKRERVVATQTNTSPAVSETPQITGTRGSSTRTGGSSSPANTSGSKSAAPATSPSSVLSSATPYSYQPPNTSSPINSQSSPKFSNAANTENQASRSAKLNQWLKANWALLGGLVLLAALALLVAGLYRRRKTGAKTKSAKGPRAQPKYSPTVALKDSLAADALVSPVSKTTSTTAQREVSTASPSKSFDEYKFRPTAVESPVSNVPVFSGDVSRASALENIERSKPVAGPAIAAPAGVVTTPSPAWVLTRPSISAPVVSDGQSPSEDQDREVFEL